MLNLLLVDSQQHYKKKKKKKRKENVKCLWLCLVQWIISFGLLAIKRLEAISMHRYVVFLLRVPTPEDYIHLPLTG